MSRAKPTTKVAAKTVLKLTAEPERLLPIRYKGQTVRIRNGEVTELEIALIPYESKILIDQALKAQDIKEVE